jgi:matrixin
MRGAGSFTSRRLAAGLVAGLLGACGGHSPSTPSTPALPAAAPPPDSIAAGSVLQVISGETSEPIDGATVIIEGKSYTSAGGRITLPERVPLRSEVGVVAPGMLERHTLVRDPAMTALALWPASSATGMNEGYTQAIVYSHPEGPTPLRRLPKGTSRVVVIPSPELRAQERALAAHQAAVDRVTAASGGQVVYVLGDQKPASGPYVETRMDAGDETCAESRVLAYASTWTIGGEIVRSLIVFCDPSAARSSIVSHEMGHTFGLFHSPDKGELMYAYYNGHGGVDFSPRESLEMRLMLQRPAGNVFPDDDRTASAATGERSYTTVCGAR